MEILVIVELIHKQSNIFLKLFFNFAVIKFMKIYNRYEIQISYECFTAQSIFIRSF